MMMMMSGLSLSLLLWRFWGRHYGWMDKTQDIIGLGPKLIDSSEDWIRWTKY